MWPYSQPFIMMPGQAQSGNNYSAKDMKRFYKAFIQAQRELDAAKKPEEKKPDAAQVKVMSTKEMMAWMTVLSPIVGLGMVNLYILCFNQMKVALQTLH